MDSEDKHPLIYSENEEDRNLDPGSDGSQGNDILQPLAEANELSSPAIQKRTSVASLLSPKKSTIIDFGTRMSESEQVALTWSDINVYVVPQNGGPIQTIKKCCKRQDKGAHKPRHILKNVFGYVEGGQLLAIMGGSGAGKTTLLNVLTKRNLGNLNVEGEVRVNGEVLPASILRTISAYVQQDDLFIGTLKVREHLIFQALLRMDKSFSYRERVERVNQVITELGLGKCEDTMIGVRNRIRGISGGERKRLAFASEVLTDPPLLFCDEPTSGLDSFMAQQVVAVLKQMAQKGKTIVCTIHQPSSPVFAMFDQLCLIAEGRIAYLGSAKQAAYFFEGLGEACPENFNPADHYIRSLAIVPGKERDCRRRVKKTTEVFEKSAQGVFAKQKTTDHSKEKADESPEDNYVLPKSRYKASWWQQFRALLWRSSLRTIREPLLIQVRVQQTIIVAFILGLVYFQTKLRAETIMNVNGVLFLFVANMTFQYVFAVVNVFCEELPVFMREHLSAIYRVGTYYWAKNAAELPQYIVFPILFTTILYWMTGLYADAGVFFVLVAINVLTANVAVSLGYAVSCIVGDISIALSVLPIIVIPLMLFGGFYMNQSSVPVYFIWIQYLSYFKYAYEAVAINEWSHITEISGCENSTCASNGHEVLQMLSFQEDRFGLDVFILALMLVALRFLGYLALFIRSCVKK